MSDEFGMPMVDCRPAHEVIADMREQLTEIKKQNVVLRGAVEELLYNKAGDYTDDIAEQALAVTQDLSGYRLCDVDPVGKILSEEEMGIGYDQKAGNVIWFNKPAGHTMLYTVKAN